MARLDLNPALARLPEDAVARFGRIGAAPGGR